VSQLDHASLIHSVLPQLYELALGGTAVARAEQPPDSASRSRSNRAITGRPFVSAPNKFAALASTSLGECERCVQDPRDLAHQDRQRHPLARERARAELRAHLRPVSRQLDHAGKVNPTQAEALLMVCCQVIGNDAALVQPPLRQLRVECREASNYREPPSFDPPARGCLK